MRPWAWADTRTIKPNKPAAAHSERMKRLIIHIGYPKTATKTLQFNVLSNLMKTGKIEYLNHLGNDSDGLGHYPCKRIMDYVLGRGSKNDCMEELRHLEKIEKPLSVISNETLSHVSERSPTAAYKTGATDNIRKLKEIFAPCFDSIEIVMTIRAQDTMVTSYYTEEYYNIINKAPEFKLIGKWIQANIERIADDRLLIFNYNEMYDEICSSFGKEKAHVLVYEDLRGNKEKYFSQLATILGLESDYVQALFEGSIRNQTQQTGQGGTRTDRELLTNGWGSGRRGSLCLYR